jgi:hypothetical protein
LPCRSLSLVLESFSEGFNKENPAELAGFSRKLAFAGAFARLLGGLLCLLPRVLARLLTLLTRVLARLLTLLTRLVALPTLLWLALVVLIHVNLLIAEI